MNIYIREIILYTEIYKLVRITEFGQHFITKAVRICDIGQTFRLCTTRYLSDVNTFNKYFELSAL